MTDRFDFNLISDRILSKSRRTYSQRNVSSLEYELIKNRKMINIKPLKTNLINRTLSFKTITLTNVENTPIKNISIEFDRSASSSKEIIEETPIKDENIENEKMSRDIQRLAVRLRSSIPLYNLPVYDNQSTKQTTVHLSQVVNRVSRCNYVLRHFVKEAQNYSLKSQDSRRRLFIDSPKQDTIINSFSEKQSSTTTTPRKASGVIKQLFSSPSSSSFKRTPSSNLIITDKRQKLF